MKIRSLAPLAVACLALLMPRLVTSGDAFGGAIGEAKPECDSMNINHQCSGASTLCKVLKSSEATSNHALQHFVEGSEVKDCAQVFDEVCTGLATEPSSECDN